MPHANPKLDFRLVHYKHFDFKFSRLDFFSAPIGISIPMVLIMDRSDGRSNPALIPIFFSFSFCSHRH